MKRKIDWLLAIPIFVICSAMIAQAVTYEWKQNQYTGKLDNLGMFRDYSARLVPYSGARRGVKLGSRGLTTDHVRFSYNPVSSITAGMMRWNAAKGTIDLGMGYDAVIQQIGMEQYYPPVRAYATNIINGQLVMVDPANVLSGERFNAILSVADGTYSSKLFLGIATMDIAHNQTGYVTTFGEVHDLSLSALKPAGETWTEGEILWADPAVNGGLTDTEPQAPNLRIAVAVVQKVAGNDLDIFVRMGIIPSLSEVNDVKIVSPMLWHFLVYNSVLGTWENKAATDIPTIVDAPTFTNFSTWVADHIYALVDPHPAPGNNRNFAYNNYGVWAGASMLNYSAGRIGVMTTSPDVGFHVVNDMAAGAARGIMSSGHSTNASAPQITFRKSRGTLTSPSIVSNGDFIGGFEAQGYDNQNYINPAFFGFQVMSTATTGVKSGTTTPSTPVTDASYAGRIPAGIVFLTGYKNGLLANNGRGERMRITPDGKVGINTTSPAHTFHVAATSATAGSNAVFGTTSSASVKLSAKGVEQTGSARMLWRKKTAVFLNSSAGTITGSVTDIQTARDGLKIDVAEVAATPGQDFRITFDLGDATQNFNWIEILGCYEGSTTHAIAIQLYNWLTGVWNTFGDMQTSYCTGVSGTMYYNGINLFVPDSTAYIRANTTPGRVRVRFYHGETGNPSHDMHVDSVTLYQ